jgi:hypothetical protein
MSTHAHLASAATVNLSFDLLRRNNILYLERRLDALSAEYKALKAAGDARAEAVRAEGLALHAQYETALRNERMGG